MLHILWRAKRCFVDDNPPPGNDDKLLSENDALCAVDMIRAELIENTPCAANDRRLLSPLGLPPNFEKLTHSAKTNALALFGGALPYSQRFYGQ